MWLVLCQNVSNITIVDFQHRLGSKVKISGKRTTSRKPCFSKLICRQFLYKTPKLSILSNIYISC